LQRIIDGSATLRGYKVQELHEKAKKGIPAIANNLTYPRASSYDQTVIGEKSWHTKSGRLEFYRPEQEFLDSGENMIVYREPIDSTFYEPNTIVAKSHIAIKPKTPDQYGVDINNLDGEIRQGRNVVKSWEQLKNTKHPLLNKGYRFVFHT
ncbi:MAG: molybdopterin oxidoreductase, partial [Candidatus Sericytochromatia bacterium]